MYSKNCEVLSVAHLVDLFKMDIKYVNSVLDRMLRDTLGQFKVEEGYILYTDDVQSRLAYLHRLYSTENNNDNTNNNKMHQEEEVNAEGIDLDSSEAVVNEQVDQVE